MEHVVKEVLEAEKKASQIIKKAEHLRNKVISQAREESVDELTKKKKEIEDTVNKSIKKELSRIQREKDSVKKDYEAQAQKVRATTKKNVDRAVDLVLEKVLSVEDIE